MNGLPFSGRNRLTFFVILVEMAIAAIMIFPGLGEDSYWLDEAASVIHAMDPPTFWSRDMHTDPNMLLYHALLGPWALVSCHETWMRTFSALFALACIPMAVHVGTKLFSRQAGLISGLVLAFHPFLIHYGREARTYTLMMFLGLWATAAFIRFWREPSARRGVGYAVPMILGIYAHIFSGLNAAAHAASVMVPPRRGIPWRFLFLAATTIIVGIIPMALLLKPETRGNVAWLTMPGWPEFAGAFRELAGSHWILARFYGCVVLAAFLFFFASWRRPENLWDRWAWALLLTGIILPTVLAFSWSHLDAPLFMPRYMATTVPMLALCAGGVLSKFPRWVAYLGIIVVSCGSVAALPLLGTPPPREGWSELTAHIRNESRPGDGIICHSRYLSSPVQLYEQLEGEVTAELFDYGTLITTSNAIDPPTPAAVDALAERFRRIWLVSGHNNFVHMGAVQDREILRANLERRYTRVSESPYGAIRLILWDRRDDLISPAGDGN